MKERQAVINQVILSQKLIFELSEAELIKQEKLAQFCSELNNHPRAIASMQMLLSLILQFLEIVLDENMFRYLLGMISVYTVLTNKMVAECARCSTKLVQKGRKEVLNGECPSIRYQRRAGAGRKSRVKQYPALRNAIIQYVRLRSYGPCTKGTQEYTDATLKSIQKYLEQKHNVKIAKSAIMLVLKAECITLRTNKKLLIYSSISFLTRSVRKRKIPKALYCRVTARKKRSLAGSRHQASRIRCPAMK